MKYAHRCSQILLPALAMSVGWGFRGNYGHEAGAMVPGALVALAVCLTSGRPEWWQRGTLMAFLGAIGWAFGGQMSYGRVIGYTAGSQFLDVTYGYASLFLIGALWGGIGAGILALSITMKRSELERFTIPLAFLWVFWLALDLSGLTSGLFELWNPYDVDWVAAGSAALVSFLLYRARPDFRAPCRLLLLLSVGWLLGFFLLTMVLGLRMTPPRGDNWAGCVGVFIALVYELRQQQNRAALRWCGYGFLFGGLGFLLGDFVNMLGRAQWSIIGTWPLLQGLDYWKWMEQLFGLIMGAGIGWGAQSFARQQTADQNSQAANALQPETIALESPAEDVATRGMNLIGLIFLLIILPWKNLHKNVFRWQEAGWIPDEYAGLAGTLWFLIVGILLSLAIGFAICKAKRNQLALIPASSLGRAQWLFLLILWMSLAGDFCGTLPRLDSRGVFVVQISFWITGALCTLLVVRIQEANQLLPTGFWKSTDSRWSFHVLTRLGAAIAVLLLCGAIGWLTIQTHDEPLPGSHLRFETSETQH
ncbi:hypothetical protein [Gimesia panareensis]|uniref:Uncharacterized protein n=1 Tax=Gimesia panareensis TaxID=2527978 RepID=A0A518AE62_9PLAN|nr:hypothetical protein [Gimesia panareensis]QDT29926.1 hypothetical protein Enr10x_52840 [Gimesia panareensis]QDU53009.1 hypothetical protein Pan110_53920 [Gimesia panareensis]